MGWEWVHMTAVCILKENSWDVSEVLVHECMTVETTTFKSMDG